MVTHQVSAPRPQEDNRPKGVPCPLCGNLRFPGRTSGKLPLVCGFPTVRDGAKVLRKATGCNAVWEAYENEEQKARQSAIKKIAEDPLNAPEPPAVLNKAQWVLSHMDLDGFAATAETAMSSYQTIYVERVLSILRARGYLEGEPVWDDEKMYFRLRFTREQFLNGNAEQVRKTLANSQEVRDAFFAMLRARGRLAIAAALKPELEAQLEARARGSAEKTEVSEQHHSAEIPAADNDGGSDPAEAPSADAPPEAPPATPRARRSRTPAN